MWPGDVHWCGRMTAKGIESRLKNSYRTCVASHAKSSVDVLAVFGGSPLFDQLLHVGRPNMPDTENLLTRLRRVLDRKWLTNDGPEVQEFERQVATLLGVRHCV